ncbi:MAG: HDOD domain-containing protein [Desulfuromonadales bacterium]|nr:HDOD domain-containing protein [Desulfuromonadales bacterium]
MANKSLTAIIKEMVDADRIRLPIHPKVAQQAAVCLAAEGPDSPKLWLLVGRDPALLCYLFRAANSSFFAGLQKTLSIEEAVTRLGSSKASQVIERVCREGAAGPQGELLSRHMPGLWRHAQGCALGARWLAKRCGYQGMADQAYLAGLLHDIGKQFLLAVLQEVSGSGELGMPLSEPLVQEVIATMHVEQGLRLFDEWNLADVYREVVADHHDEELDTQNILVVLVKLANKGCRKVGLGPTIHPDIVLPTTAEAQFLGLDEISLAEFEIMLEDHFLRGKPAAAGP